MSIVYLTQNSCQTLPIGYYPALSDADIDKVLMDQSIYTVEWMITRAEDVKQLDLDSLTLGNNYVSSELRRGLELTAGRSRQNHQGEPVFVDERIAFDEADGSRAVRRRSGNKWWRRSWRYHLAGSAKEDRRRRMDTAGSSAGDYCRNPRIGR